MTTSSSTDVTVDTIADSESPGSRRWLDVTLLWVAAVGAQALILFLLMQHQLQQWHTLKFESVANLLREGQVKAAAAQAASTDYIAYPTDALVDFALVGLAVMALAWTGRRTLAWALPLLVALVSLSPSFSTGGSASLQPISELGDWSLWQSLSAGLPGDLLGQSWALLLGVVVQTALLMLPLVAAPRRRSQVSLVAAARTAALPTVGVMVLALATLEYSSLNELYWMPLAAVAVGLLAGGIVTGTGSAWVRLPAAVGVPAILGAVVMPLDLSGAAPDAASGFGVAVAALIVAVGTASAPSIHEWLARLRHTEPAVPASA